MSVKETVMDALRQNEAADGAAQFNFSHDMSAKQSEMETLNELELEGQIQRLSGLLGYAIYRIL